MRPSADVVDGAHRPQLVRTVSRPTEKEIRPAKAQRRNPGRFRPQVVKKQTERTTQNAQKLRVSSSNGLPARNSSRQRYRSRRESHPSAKVSPRLGFCSPAKASSWRGDLRQSARVQPSGKNPDPARRLLPARTPSKKMQRTAKKEQRIVIRRGGCSGEDFVSARKPLSVRASSARERSALGEAAPTRVSPPPGKCSVLRESSSRRELPRQEFHSPANVPPGENRTRRYVPNSSERTDRCTHYIRRVFVID